MEDELSESLKAVKVVLEKLIELVNNAPVKELGTLAHEMIEIRDCADDAVGRIDALKDM